MSLIFDNTILTPLTLHQALPSLIDARFISSQKTRLNGEIIHFELNTHQEVFVKMGTGYERLEIIREYKNISLLNGYLPTPKIYDYIDLKNQAIVVLEKVPGFPLHSMTTSLGRQRSLELITDILNAFYNVPKSVKNTFEIAVLQELQDIESLIDNNKINKDKFQKDSKDFTPAEAYDKIQNDLKDHSVQMLSHGDLCLPNIIVTPEGKWSLIDWGKGGLGDKCRDLSAIEGSLRRNLDEKAFADLCRMMKIDQTLEFRRKIYIYKLIDFFWYNADLEKL